MLHDGDFVEQGNCRYSSGLLPQEAPVMIAEQRKLFFSFLSTVDIDRFGPAGSSAGVGRICPPGCWGTPTAAGSGLGSPEGISCVSLSCSAQNASARGPLH